MSGRCILSRARGSLISGARVSLELLSFLVLVLVVAGHGVLELAHAGAERLAEPGKALRPENHEHYDEDDDQLKWADVRHVLIVECGHRRGRRFATFLGPVRLHDPRA